MTVFRYINKKVVIIPLDEHSKHAVEEYKEQMFTAVYEISQIYHTNEFFARECQKSEIVEALLSSERIEWRAGATYVDRINKVLVIPDTPDLEVCIVMEPIEEPFEEEEDP